ncbi:MAG: hypothetical protein ACRCXT_20555 [Paraclostridium sp.]
MDYLVLNCDITRNESYMCNCVAAVCLIRVPPCSTNGCNRLGCCSQGGRSIPTQLFSESK